MKDAILIYNEGEIDAFCNLNLDRWSYPEALSLVKELRYVDFVKLWWKESNGGIEECLKSITSNSHALGLEKVGLG